METAPTTSKRLENERRSFENLIRDAQAILGDHNIIWPHARVVRHCRRYRSQAERNGVTLENYLLNADAVRKDGAA